MSIAVESEGMKCRRYDLPDDKIPGILAEADRTTFFIPESTDFDTDEYQLFSAQFLTIIRHYAVGSASEYLLALAGFCELTSMLDSRFRRSVSGATSRIDPGTLYVYKAKKFICSHLGEPLKLERIAGELGISAPYLCTLFRRVNGRTVTDYIGVMRCRQIREQILHTGDRFADICDRAGIRDIRYAQRLFKKHFGVSMQECRRLGSGITLYHENPWKLDHIDRDIYEQDAQAPDPSD